MTTKGRLLLLTGPAGAGKSTVAEAMPRLPAYRRRSWRAFIQNSVGTRFEL